MRPSLLRRDRPGRSPTLALAAAFLLPTLAGAQATVTGKATAGGQPIVDVRVLVRGTSLTATTNAQGVYTLRNVPTGAQIIEALRVGYRAQQANVQVAGGDTKTVDFAMEVAVVQLADVVTTATGEQRRVELGNAVSTLGDVNKRVETIADQRTLADLLVAKAPGVIVLPGNDDRLEPGRAHPRHQLAVAEQRADLRHRRRAHHLRLRRRAARAARRTSFLNDVNPEEIEDIEIVKGPSAATLYGTDAANGVIVITTKKGRAGATRWTWYGEAGSVDDRNQYPSQYALFGHTRVGRVDALRARDGRPPARASPDSLTSFNLLLELERHAARTSVTATSTARR